MALIESHLIDVCHLRKKVRQTNLTHDVLEVLIILLKHLLDANVTLMVRKDLLKLLIAHRCLLGIFERIFVVTFIDIVLWEQTFQFLSIVRLKKSIELPAVSQVDESARLAERDAFSQELEDGVGVIVSIFEVLVCDAGVVLQRTALAFQIVESLRGQTTDDPVH